MVSDEKLQLITGQIFVGYSILIAYELGIFNLLSKSPLSIKDLSTILEIKKRSVQAMISCSCSLDLVEHNDGNYQLSQIGKTFFDQENFSYYGGVFDLLIKESKIMNYEVIKKSLLTNRSQVGEGEDIFSGSSTLGKSENFVRALHQKALLPAFHWTKKFALDGYTRIVDIGGGSGIHIIAACLSAPNLQGIICDRDSILTYTTKNIKKFGLEKRITTKQIDMWKDEFPNGDIFFLGDIFHDWSHKKCSLLAEKCFQQLPENGLIILHEMLFNENKTGPFLSAAYNMKMMLWTEGQQFSAIEIKNILNKVGFKRVTIRKSLGNWSLIIGRKKAKRH